MMMKWTPSMHLENRTFDQRLVKRNLLDSRAINPHQYIEQMDYRQFKSTYVI